MAGAARLRRKLWQQYRHSCFTNSGIICGGLKWITDSADERGIYLKIKNKIKILNTKIKFRPRPGDFN